MVIKEKIILFYNPVFTILPLFYPPLQMSTLIISLKKIEFSFYLFLLGGIHANNKRFAILEISLFKRKIKIFYFKISLPV